ncbi:hypothetical protein HPB50_023853 [Hyalomma asiaticum]|uniref:Uncharacterized protein n=1 Tax=Hyalomma asiaticum TaxID=266040 RepID=A0ACB7S2L9_HYAAI|nr:hypothetical protein HPB50_023853 [Hyalomma asiaticum]
MPPRKNTARRGRPWAKFGDSGDRTPSSQDEASDGAEVVASTDNTMKPGEPAKKPATPARKVAAPKPRPAAASAAIEPAAKKRAVTAKPAAAKGDSVARTVSEASEAEAEDDGPFEALVLDADDDEEVPAGDGETGAEEEAAANDEGVAVTEEENGEGDVDAAEPGDAPDGGEVADDGNGDYAGEPEEGAEGWEGEAAEGDANEGGTTAEYEEGGEAEFAEGDEMVDAEHPTEDGMEADAAAENAGENAPNGALEPSAEGDEGAEPPGNEVAVKVEDPGEDAAASGVADAEGETIVRDLAPSDRDFVAPEDEEVKEEPTTEVTRLWDLCPDVELDSAETITTSVHEGIQRCVRQFIERLLRDAKETGTVPDDASVAAQDGKPMFGCDLCNITMAEPELFDCHIESQRHVKRLRWLYFMSMNKELGNYHCRVCRMSVPCKDHLVGHFRSDRHQCLSKCLNVHPKYAEHALSQHYPKGDHYHAAIPLQAWGRAAVGAQSCMGQDPRCSSPNQGSAVWSAETLAKRAGMPDLLTAPRLCLLSTMFMAFSLFFCLTAKVKSLLQPQQQQPPSATASQPSATGGSGQQTKNEELSPPPSSQGFIFHCEICQVIAYHEDQIQEGKKHRAKMAEELEKLEKQKPDTAKKGTAKGDGAQTTKAVSKDTVKGPSKGTAPKKGPVPPLGHKRQRSPSPFSRGPAWSPPPHMRSPPRDIWSGGPPPRKRSPEPFLDPMARDLFSGSSGPGGAFEPGLRGPQPGVLEDYAERRGPGGMPDPTSVAATLETMIQLQQRLLNITGPQQGSGGGSGGYHDEEYGRGLQDMDLQKSLQQLRQSQRYSVGGSPPPYGAGGTLTKLFSWPIHGQLTTTIS